MRVLLGSAPVVFAFGMLLHGCEQLHRTAPVPGEPADGLAVGQPAPEIEGEDLEGVPFKLSDYRGKVVVLDFWGTW
jgi:cytochrome oxidase Cu insertion factor (SCO1/SenC/PrrC family)